MAAEVDAHAVAERVATDVFHELLQNRRALAVGDAVEVQERDLGVFGRARDGVRGGQLVLLVGPALDVGVEHLPRVREARRLDHRDVRDVRGKALVEPQVVPPAHRHQVAEPHVRELVQERLGAVQPLVLGGRIAEQVRLVVGDAADVLHRARVVLGHEDLVVLRERDRAGRTSRRRSRGPGS